MIKAIQSCPEEKRLISSDGFIRYPIKIEDEEVKITVVIEHVNVGMATFLIDTGAQMSFLRYKSIQNKNEINRQMIIKIRGAIAGIKSSTVGTLSSGLYIDNIFYPHVFNIIKDCIMVGDVEGVIGSDFLEKYKCKINFAENVIELIRPRVLSSKNELGNR